MYISMLQTLLLICILSKLNDYKLRYKTDING